jgi:hypothetical protein
MSNDDKIKLLMKIHKLEQYGISNFECVNIETPIEKLNDIHQYMSKKHEEILKKTDEINFENKICNLIELTKIVNGYT